MTEAEKLALECGAVSFKDTESNHLSIGVDELQKFFELAKQQGVKEWLDKQEPVAFVTGDEIQEHRRVKAFPGKPLPENSLLIINPKDI